MKNDTMRPIDGEGNDSGMNLVPVDIADDTDRNGVFTALADLPAKALLTEPAMANAFGVTGRTIRRMVTRHELPPPVAMSGKSVWLAGRVLSWIEKAAELQEREAEHITAKIRAFNS